RTPHRPWKDDGSCVSLSRALSSTSSGGVVAVRFGGDADAERIRGGEPIMTPARRVIPVVLVLGLAGLLAIAAGDRAAGQQRTRDPIQPKRLTPPEQIETDVVTREAVCRWATNPPVLDGKLD